MAQLTVITMGLFHAIFLCQIMKNHDIGSDIFAM